MLKLGSLMADKAILMTNLFGLALNIIYLSFFYFYTIGKDKNKLWLNIGISGAVSAAILAYGEYEDPDVLEFRLGVLLTVLLFGLIASPFLSLVNVWNYIESNAICRLNSIRFIYIFSRISFEIKAPTAYRSRWLRPVPWCHLCGFCMDFVSIMAWWCFRMYCFSRWVLCNCRCLQYIHRHRL